MHKYATEAIGTFFLVLTIGTTFVAGIESAPLAIGSALTALVYMGGPVSGAHYNPAVSIAVLLHGRMETRDFVPYIIAQSIGASLAAVAVFAISGSTFAPAPGPDVGVLPALLAEILFTFALVIVILQTAPTPTTKGNSNYGLAIGFTVMAGAFAVGPVSGAAFNPAVGFGPILIDSFAGAGTFADLWLYIVGPVIGGVAAAFVYRLQATPAQPAA